MHQRLIVSAIILIATALSGHGASELNAGLAFMKKGSYKDGRAALQRAYKRNPADPRTKFAYAASLTDATLARPLYESLCDDTAASDSIRSLSCGRLGDLLYLKAEYEPAARQYEQAREFRESAGLRVRQARSLINAGNVAAAGVVLADAVADSGIAGLEAWHLLGTLYSAADSCARAIEAFDRALAVADTAPWKASALMGKIRCETRLGNTAAAQKAQRELDVSFPDYLEKHSVQIGIAAAAEPVTADTAANKPATESTANPGPSAGTFTLQVGSFGSAVNAQNLRDKLKKDFADVRLESIRAKGTLFYRVRVGSFPSKDDALAFADKNLTPRSISFSVITQ